MEAEMPAAMSGTGWSIAAGISASTGRPAGGVADPSALLDRKAGRVPSADRMVAESALLPAIAAGLPVLDLRSCARWRADWPPPRACCGARWPAPCGGRSRGSSAAAGSRRRRRRRPGWRRRCGPPRRRRSRRASGRT
ncbi:hypothetical protein MMR14E_27155 [Methylobacterium mesophilicum]